MRKFYYTTFSEGCKLYRDIKTTNDKLVNDAIKLHGDAYGTKLALSLNELTGLSQLRLQLLLMRHNRLRQQLKQLHI